MFSDTIMNRLGEKEISHLLSSGSESSFDDSDADSDYQEEGELVLEESSETEDECPPLTKITRRNNGFTSDSPGPSTAYLRTPTTPPTAGTSVAQRVMSQASTSHCPASAALLGQAVPSNNSQSSAGITTSGQEEPKWGQTNMPTSAGMFSSDTGPTYRAKQIIDPTPQEIFGLMISPDVIDLIVFQTNLYAQEKHLKTGKTYVPTTDVEIRVFIGMNMLMGIKPLPSYRDYWSSDPDLHDVYMSKLMSLNRFGWLLSNIHINDNSTAPRPDDPTRDKLYKVRPFLDLVAKNFKSCINPSKSMSVDESMIKFKGRSSLKQYMPKKPIKRGYKVWVLADKSGYAYKFDIYTGKKGDSIEKNLGENVVTSLLQGEEDKCHTVFFDNYFTGVPLMHKLKKLKINACGTVNPTRKFLPKLKEDSKLKRGESDWATSDTGLSVVKWKDKRSVHVLSNFHDPTQVVDVKRKEKDGSISMVPCPKMVVDYNMDMNCVDKFDQMKSTYEIDRKSHKPWHRIFWYFVDASVVNAYLIYKQLSLPKLSMKDFRRQISRDWVAPALVSSRANKRKSSGSQTGAKKPHVSKAVRLEGSAHQPQRSTRRRCAKCSTVKQQVRTDWMCSVCKVPLCLGKSKSCFQEYHR